MSAASLSERLRTETKDVHTAAERSGIMRQLLRGEISVASYVALLGNLAALYEALESALARHAAHDSLRAIEWHRLARLPTLRHDMAALSAGLSVGMEGREDAPQGSGAEWALAPATREYVAHLHRLSDQHPERLWAHAYLRYLGDMYGGQIIKRLVLASVAGGDARAVSFYEFAEIDDLAAFLTAFRVALDDAPLHPTTPDAMVAEARFGYELHARMFTELATPDQAA